MTSARVWDCLGDNVESFLQEERRVKELGEAYLSRARAGDSLVRHLEYFPIVGEGYKIHLGLAARGRGGGAWSKQWQLHNEGDGYVG